VLFGRRNPQNQSRTALVLCHNFQKKSFYKNKSQNYFDIFWQKSQKALALNQDLSIKHGLFHHEAVTNSLGIRCFCAQWKVFRAVAV
jgi:hypothetical protein